MNWHCLRIALEATGIALGGLCGLLFTLIGLINLGQKHPKTAWVLGGIIAFVTFTGLAYIGCTHP